MAVQRRPFHESVVDAIFRAERFELVGLARLIRGTEIPKNHDRIIEAWFHQCKKNYRGDLIHNVAADLRVQKEAAAAKEAVKKAKKEKEAVSS